MRHLSQGAKQPEMDTLPVQELLQAGEGGRSDYDNLFQKADHHAGIKRAYPAESNSSKAGTGALTSAVEWSASSSPCTSQATTRRVEGRKRRRAAGSLLNEPVCSMEMSGKPPALVLSSAASTSSSLEPAGVACKPHQLLMLPQRHETVRRVERRVAGMFRELDLLLQAEKINRRVMYRWSGADKNKVRLDESSTGYCTWGRELVKQAVEDAIGDVRSSLSATKEFSSCAEATRRLTHLYLNKASERLILVNEKPLHEEVMSNIGNLWFTLIPKIPKEERMQFQKLVARMIKAGGTHSLVSAFRCAVEFARLDIWDGTNHQHLIGEDQVEYLDSLLGSDDLYKCDAYICLWEAAELLAASLEKEEEKEGECVVVAPSSSSREEMMAHRRVLCQEYRLKALDAEMWRGMLLEEQESRHKADDIDEWDEDDEEEEEEGDEDCDEEEDEEMMEMMMEEEEAQQQQQEEAATAKRGGDTGIIPFVTLETGNNKDEKEAVAAARQERPDDAAAMQQEEEEQRDGAISPLAVEAAVSQYSSFRRSLEGGEGPNNAERWASKAALEIPEQELYIDYLSKQQHEYRRVLTPEFRAKVFRFLEDCTPITTSEEQQEAPSPHHLLLNRARPFLYRVATNLSTDDLVAYLDLIKSKIGYESTLLLLEPIIIHDREAFSSNRVSQALSWAVSCDNGAYLPAFLDRLLPMLTSRTELRQLAFQAVAYGPASFPLIDRALAQVPHQDYDNVAIELCRCAAQIWPSKGWGAYLVVLRALHRIPSLRLYLRCRVHFTEPIANLLRPLMQHLDPCGELSIGIRLVEGMVASAVSSIARSLQTPGSLPQKDRAQRWLDFAFAGVRGGHFPPCLIEKLCADATFMSCVLGPPAADRDFLQSIVTILGRLTELAHSHPRIVAGPCRLILAHYEAMAQRMSCAMDASVLAAGEGILRAVGELSSSPTPQQQAV